MSNEWNDAIAEARNKTRDALNGIRLIGTDPKKYDSLVGLSEAFLAVIAEQDAVDKALAQKDAELERERGRLAACGVAALVYFKGCSDEYKSASLDDVLRLHTALAEAREDLKNANSAMDNLARKLTQAELRANPGGKVVGWEWCDGSGVACTSHDRDYMESCRGVMESAGKPCTLYALVELPKGGEKIGNISGDDSATRQVQTCPQPPQPANDGVQPHPLDAELRGLVRRWKADALSAVTPEYADRELHGKYLSLDNRAAGLDEAADELEAILNGRGK